MKRFSISPFDFNKEIGQNFEPESKLNLDRVMGAAEKLSVRPTGEPLRFSDVIISIYELEPALQQIFTSLDITPEDVREVARWYRRVEVNRARRSRFWDRANLWGVKGIGKDWAGGYTIQLDRVAQEITRQVIYKPPPLHLYGHRQKLSELAQALLHGPGNTVLVGLPGVGRNTLVRAFAAQVNRGESLGPLNFQRVLQIDSSAIISGTSSVNDAVDKVQALFGEAYKAENVILVINNIDAILDATPEAGRINATEILLPFFESRLRVIGLTTPGGYTKTIERNSNLAKVFTKLELGELTPEETLEVLENEAIKSEGRNGIYFTFPALKEIAKLTSKLIQNIPNPQKSLEIMEASAVYAATQLGERVVTAAHVSSVVSERTKIPVGQVDNTEKDTLLHLEDLLHERIVGQDEAIQEISNSLRRARSGVRSEKRPIGSFLFLGPTGVGKTETTKALASVYFGDEKRIIRFDMSEFQEVEKIDEFIGDGDTGSPGLLTEAVIRDPFSLILLDEIEKAHPKILDLFLQVLDDGRLTDSGGRTVDFTNTMIIATSNAAAEKIREMVQQGVGLSENKQKIVDLLLRGSAFRPEFINRFDAVVIFRPLTREEVGKVANLLLEELNQRLNEKKIQIRVTPELIQFVVDGGYSAEFGARPLRRYIQEQVENYIAKLLLQGKVQRGDIIDIPVEMLEKNTQS